MPWAARRRELASELETAPAIRARLPASASMKKLTVEPVPTPMTVPGWMNWSAAAAARCFFWSWLMCFADP